MALMWLYFALIYSRRPLCSCSRCPLELWIPCCPRIPRSLLACSLRALVIWPSSCFDTFHFFFVQKRYILYIEQSVKFERKFKSHASCMIFNLVSGRLYLVCLRCGKRIWTWFQRFLLCLYRGMLVFFLIWFSFSAQQRIRKVYFVHDMIHLVTFLLNLVF